MTRKTQPPSLLTKIYITLTTLLTYLITFLPPSIQHQIFYIRDLIHSILNIFLSRFFYSSIRNFPAVDLTGKTAIITGANSGIGLQLATDLARANCTVYLACRSASKAQSAIKMVNWRVAWSIGKIHFLELDTSDLESVKSCAVAWSKLDDQNNKKIDILIHNAGIPDIPFNKKEFTPDANLEIMYATNFLGSFLLTHLLEPYLSETARVIFTGSSAQYGGKLDVEKIETKKAVRGKVEKGFHCPPPTMVLGWTVDGKNKGFDRYQNTKLMQSCFARGLQDRFDRLAAPSSSSGDEKSGGGGKRKLAFAYNPGLIETTILMKMYPKGIFAQIGQRWFEIFTRICGVDVEEGAATGSWLAMTDDKKVVGKRFDGAGGYFDRQERYMSPADLMKKEQLEKLWVRWENDAGIEWK